MRNKVTANLDHNVHPYMRDFKKGEIGRLLEGPYKDHHLMRTYSGFVSLETGSTWINVDDNTTRAEPIKSVIITVGAQHD